MTHRATLAPVSLERRVHRINSGGRGHLLDRSDLTGRSMMVYPDRIPPGESRRGDGRGRADARGVAPGILSSLAHPTGRSGPRRRSALTADATRSRDAR